jgi:hypothetical protein
LVAGFFESEEEPPELEPEPESDFLESLEPEDPDEESELDVSELFESLFESDFADESPESELPESRPFESRAAERFEELLRLSVL